MTDNNVNMLVIQAQLAEEYKYEPLPGIFSMMQREMYEQNLPEWLKKEKTGPIKLLSLSGTEIAKDFTRVVIGDYGAFIEISPKDILMENIMIKPGQEYRMKEKRYAEHVKYHWYTTRDHANPKLYFQQKTVDYADYKVGMWYISPYECKPLVI